MPEDFLNSLDQPVRVLIVEDNEIDRRIIESMLLESSSNISFIKIVDTLFAAIKILEHNPIDVIILDLNLPDSKGPDTLLQINKRFPEVAIVINTGAYEDALGIKTLSYGAQEFLVKGRYSTYLFHKTLRYAIERKRLELELLNAHKKLKETQDELIQSEKMKVVGALASGIAHEVKNPLSIILYGTTFLAQHLKDPDEKIKLVLDNIKEAVDRANVIINDLLNFSSLTHLHMYPEDLNIITEKSLFLVKHECESHHVDIVYEFDKSIPNVKIDRNRIEQVVINLILNSIQAMPKGGVIRLSTHCLQVTKDVKEMFHMKEGGYSFGEKIVVLGVEDNGQGIREENLNHLFEPFFTTKRDMGGIGLGLAVSKNILELHNAQIYMQNRIEGGVKATIIFKV